MSHPGLSYPCDETYLKQIKNNGYFIFVDRNATNISLVPGGEINNLLNSNSKLFFVFGANLAGTRQDIIDALYLVGFSIEQITQIITSAICIDNVKTDIAQQWIALFQKQNTQKSTLTSMTQQEMIVRQETQTAQPIITRQPLQLIVNQVKHNENAPNLSYPVKSTYSSDHINFLRTSIHDHINKHDLGGNANFETIPDILDKLFRLYDEIFFKKQLSEIVAKDKIQLLFNYSDKLTKTGGHCERNGCIYTIKLSQPIILGTFRNGEKVHISNGLQCYDRLACLMNLFEHELIHFAIFITHGHVKQNTIYKAHGLYFQQLMMAYFGHTEFKHSLTKKIEKAGKREDFNLNDIVSYESNTGETVTGRIIKLNPKRAIVGKMTVPYTILRPASKEEEINKNELITNLTEHSLKVGDIVSYEIGGNLTTGRIDRINPKTYLIGNYKVSKPLIRLATESEKQRFLLSPDALQRKTRNDFYIGQSVKFTHSKTGDIITGTIQKLNPTRVVVNQYTVPYAMLSPA